MTLLSLARRSATLVLLVWLPAAVWASVGTVVIASGEVFAIDGSEAQRPLKRRSDVFQGDTLVTGADGSLQLRFQDNAILALREHSRLLINDYRSQGTDNESEQVLMDLLSGGFRTITGNIGQTDQDAYQVRTPNASIGIRGTHYEAVLDENDLLLGVYQGGIRVRNDAGQLNLGAGESFFFARVAGSARPEGLLTPPEQLNRPFSPQSHTAPQPQPEDEPTAALTEEESDGIAIEQAFDSGTNEPPPVIPATGGDGTENVDTETFSLTPVEEELAELVSEGASGDQRLTLEQIEQLSQQPPKTGFVVVMDPPGDGDGDDTDLGDGQEIESHTPVHFGYFAEGETGPVLANFNSEQLTELDGGYKTPDNVFKGPSGTELEAIASHEVGTGTVDWGIWNASAGDTAKLYTDPASSDHQQEVAAPYFVVSAQPAKSADLIGRGSTTFTLGCAIQPCIVANRPVYSIEAMGDFSVNFADGGGNGKLNFMAASSENPQLNDNWVLVFEGQIDGAQFFSTLTQSSSVTDSQEATFGITGNVDGLFTGPGTDLHFVGGFGAHGVESEHELHGVFIMKEEQ